METVMARSRAAMGAVVPNEARRHMRAAWRENILAVRPSERKTAVMLFTMFCCLGLIVTFVGIFFRGPGYTFVIPYVTTPGLHFAL